MVKLTTQDSEPGNQQRQHWVYRPTDTAKCLPLCKGIDENAGTGDRSDMRKQGIGENIGTGDRSATDIFVRYRRRYYG